MYSLGSRPSMADKILRRTSYGGEQTDSLSKDPMILVIDF